MNKFTEATKKLDELFNKEMALSQEVISITKELIGILDDDAKVEAMLIKRDKLNNEILEINNARKSLRARFM